MGLKDQLEGVIPDQVLQKLSDRFTVIGDIAILSLPDELTVYKQTIATAVMSRQHAIRTVLNKISPLAGEDRTAFYEILAGGSTVTVCREYGFLYELDVQRAFFNPRLSTERDRVTGQVRHGEQVIVPFCGVGPFAIPAAVRGARVVAIDQNPDACFRLSRNIRLNHVEEKVTIVKGNAFEHCQFSLREFDRAIIPTPYGMDAILDIIVPLVKQGGMIHFYTFRKKHQIPEMIEEFRTRGLDVRFFRACGNVAPAVSRWVFDLERSADKGDRFRQT
jgi:tRNA (guanine37-N1)-methyltransferase